MTQWVLPLAMALVLLAGCDNQHNDEQANIVMISKLERQSLHFWRVRALSEEASGPWSDPAYFRVLDGTMQAAGVANPGNPVPRTGASEQAISNLASTATPLAKTNVRVNGLFEGAGLPMPAWDTVDSATGFEFEITNVDADSIQVSRLLDRQSVCSVTVCAVLLSEIDAPGNAPPQAIIDQLEIDPAQPDVLSFTAENSFDADGVIVEYRWRVDGRFTGISTSVNFEYSFNDYGTYRVGLEVTDDTGTTDLNFIEVEVGVTGMPTLIAPDDSNDAGNQDIPPLVQDSGSGPIGSGPIGSGPIGDLGLSDYLPVAVNEPITTATADSWQLRGTANAVLTLGNTVFVGGDFTEIVNDSGASLPRSNLAALNRYTGQPTRFAPNLNGQVWALALSPDKQTLYVGGSFLMAEGLPRPRIAAYDIQTGQLTNFVTQTPDRALRAIAVNEDRVYLGGLFTRIGNTDRRYVAAFDRVTGQLDQGFSASPDDIVMALVAERERLWIGGSFSSINNSSQRGVGAVDSATGSLLPTAEVDYRVIAMAATATQLFVAGGDVGGNASAIDLSTGLSLWEISGDGKIQAVDADDGRYVYFGGHYEDIAGDGSGDRLTRHDKSTGATDTTWLPRVNGIRSINALDVTADGLYIVGDFTRVDAKPKEGFAIFPGLTN